MRFPLAVLAALAVATPALAVDSARLERSDPETVTLVWEDRDKVEIYLADAADTPLKQARKLETRKGGGSLTIAMPASRRQYVRIVDRGDRSITTVAERLLPLQQGSNFRDLGGYVGAGGKKIRWGRIFRSGAMPVLSEQDYKVLGGLGISAIVDLRSLDEREVAPTQLDDRSGALYVSNDYSLKALMADFQARGGEVVYAGMEKRLAPQYRAIFKRLLAADGATLYNCSAGQDRTGVASALILAALGVDRKTILEDYHLSTPSRRLQWEMPEGVEKTHPDNLIVQYYVASSKQPGGRQAEPLFNKAGQSHLAQFFAHLDQTYGGVEGYLRQELGIGPLEIARLRLLYLE